ncbi:hypothetical protein NDU88_003138 [Pleurodeles waltl]|uniref:Uncharacterized protein n=1 Tax=Pleurodeles waltl TaxID=8319 RepID=A0AAV7KUS4_PLEWA|nr:hypothetical protein NDU88_003138 [Pleurodeles waltl]
MHLPGKDNRVADELSRLPLTNENCEEVDDNECDVALPYDDMVFIEDHGNELEFSKDKWIKKMQKDGILAKVATTVSIPEEGHRDLARKEQVVEYSALSNKLQMSKQKYFQKCISKTNV